MQCGSAGQAALPTSDSSRELAGAGGCSTDDTTTPLAEGFSTDGGRSHHSRRGEEGKHRCPSCLAPLGRYSRGLTRVSLASFVMAASFPCCEIRQLLVDIYPGGSKAGAAGRITVFYGRRGRPVKKPRFIPAELAHQWARKLQARRLGTVSVL